MTSTAVISGTGSGAVRRFVTSDDPAYDFTPHVGPDETLTVVDGPVQTASLVAPSDYAVVDAAMLVLAIVKADHLIDTSPDGVLVPSYPGVFPGCTYDEANDIFIAPIVDYPGGEGPEGPYPPYQTGGPIARPEGGK